MASNNNNPIEEVSGSGVDATPISPVERRNSLEKHLQQRPNVQELKDRNILLNTNAAPALQSAQQDLERQRVSDNLRKNLQNRPERDELVERNILPQSTAAPALQSNQRELAKHMRANSLENALKSRPSPEDLIKEGILKSDENPLKE